MDSVPALSALLLGLSLVSFGCSKEATPSAEQPKPPTQTQPAAANATAAGEGDKSGTVPAAAIDESAAEPQGDGDLKNAKASYSETNFTLNIKGAGDYKSGQQGALEIVLEAKAPFHANEKYPYKFKLGETAGVTFPANVVKKDQAKIENMKVTMPVAFTAAAAGKKRIAGMFHFSVCTDDKCLIEKRPLAFEVDVK